MNNVLDRNQTVTDSKDMLAKLLASENLTVIRGNVKTASFDTVNRVLTLPMWNNLSVEIEDMLIGHEVGHALFTTNDYLEEEKQSRALFSYMNVIEDVRIEKAMKRKYPGLRKVFHQAYTQLQEQDFFGLEGRDLRQVMLIDRINLYYKAGYKCGVTFTKEEAAYVKRVNECETMKDVYDLAVEMLGYARQKRDEQKEEMKKLALSSQTEEDIEDDIEVDEDGEEGFGDDDSFGDGFDDDMDTPEDEEEQEAETKESPVAGSAPGRTEWDDPEKDLESVTDRTLADKLEKFAETDRKYINIEYDGKNSFSHDPLVPYKTVLAELSASLGNGGQEKWARGRLNDLNSKIMRDVNYLVKEFEMRKQAQRYKRTTTSKSGELAVNKLFSYKLTDDLFKRISVMPDGKNHGMIMLVDWSGSMHDCISDVIEQIIILTTFCKRIQIPFRVYAFSDSYRSPRFDEQYFGEVRTKENARRATGKPQLSMSRFYLMEFFNEKMSQQEFSRMSVALMARPWSYANGYSLGGTPLNESLWYMLDHSQSFIKQNSIEKFTFVTLSDGEGHPLYPENFQTTTIVQEQTEYGLRNKRVQNSINLVDTMTRRSYEIELGGYHKKEIDSALLKMFKHRLNATVIGYHILRNNSREVGNFMRNNATTHSFSPENEALFHEIRTNLRRDGFSSSDKFGRDKMFIIRQDRLRVTDDKVAIDNTKNAAGIARQFAKMLDGRKSNKVILNQFVELIA